MTRQERLELAPLALLLACVVAVVGLVVRYADALDGPVVVVTTRPAVYEQDISHWTSANYISAINEGSMDPRVLRWLAKAATHTVTVPWTLESGCTLTVVTNVSYGQLDRERDANRRTLAGPEVEAMGR